MCAELRDGVSGQELEREVTRPKMRRFSTFPKKAGSIRMQFAVILISHHLEYATTAILPIGTESDESHGFCADLEYRLHTSRPPHHSIQIGTLYIPSMQHSSPSHGAI